MTTIKSDTLVQMLNHVGAIAVDVDKRYIQEALDALPAHIQAPNLPPYDWQDMDEDKQAPQYMDYIRKLFPARSPVRMVDSHKEIIYEVPTFGRQIAW